MTTVQSYSTSRLRYKSHQVFLISQRCIRGLTFARAFADYVSVSYKRDLKPYDSKCFLLLLSVILIILVHVILNFVNETQGKHFRRRSQLYVEFKYCLQATQTKVDEIELSITITHPSSADNVIRRETHTRTKSGQEVVCLDL